jgi:hypothetical protein
MSEQEEIKVVVVVKVELPELDRPNITDFCPLEDCSVDECGCGGSDQF